MWLLNEYTKMVWTRTDRKSLAKGGSWFVCKTLLPKKRAANGTHKKKLDISTQTTLVPAAAMWTMTLKNDMDDGCGVALSDVEVKHSCTSTPPLSVINETPLDQLQRCVSVGSGCHGGDSKDAGCTRGVSSSPAPASVSRLTRSAAAATAISGDDHSNDDSDTPPILPPSSSSSSRNSSRMKRKIKSPAAAKPIMSGNQSRRVRKRSKADDDNKSIIQATETEMYLSSTVMVLDRGTNEPCARPVLECSDGKDAELKQRQFWESSHSSAMVRHYDPVHHRSTKHYGIGEANVEHFTGMAHYTETESPDGFIMLRCMAANQGKLQQDLMNRLVAKMIAERGDEDKGYQQVTGKNDLNSHIRYSSDHVFPDGTRYVMNHARAYHKNGYKRGKDNNNKASAVTELKRHVEIVLLDPSPGMMLKLRRIYMAQNDQPLEVGRHDGRSKLGDFQSYLDAGMAARYIKQGTHIYDTTKHCSERN
jgi:hypothetical protein